MRYTVCPQPVDTVSSYIMWNDAEQAASVNAPAVSPFKAGSSADKEWLRFYNKAKSAPSGVSSFGHRIKAA